METLEMRITTLLLTPVMALGLVWSAGSPSSAASRKPPTMTELDIHASDPSAHGGDVGTLRNLDCDAGDFARLDPHGSGQWQCLSPAELKRVLGLPKTGFILLRTGPTHGKSRSVR